MAYVRLFTIYITACYIQCKGQHTLASFRVRMLMQYYTQTQRLALAMHAHAGMGGSMLAHM